VGGETHNTLVCGSVDLVAGSTTPRVWASPPHPTKTPQPNPPQPPPKTEHPNHPPTKPPTKKNAGVGPPPTGVVLPPPLPKKTRERGHTQPPKKPHQSQPQKGGGSLGKGGGGASLFLSRNASFILKMGRAETVLLTRTLKEKKGVERSRQGARSHPNWPKLSEGSNPWPTKKESRDQYMARYDKTQTLKK